MMLALLQQMDMMSGNSDSLEHAYFWVGALIALTPVIVFGYIGFLVTRAYFREQRREAGDAAPRIRIKLSS